MEITLDEPPRLVGADDFKAFKVVAYGQPDAAALAAQTAALGRAVGDEHVWIAPAALLELAGERAADAAWNDALAKMIAYAREAGWVDDAGAIRAHVEWRER